MKKLKPVPWKPRDHFERMIHDWYEVACGIKIGVNKCREERVAVLYQLALFCYVECRHHRMYFESGFIEYAVYEFATGEQVKIKSYIRRVRGKQNKQGWQR